MVRYNGRAISATPARAATRRSGKARTSNKRGVPTHPRRGRVDARITLSPQRAVYDGRDRLGSFQHGDGVFTAFGRRGQSLGTFTTQGAAIAAIERGAVS
jgi:hypothetical protein